MSLNQEENRGILPERARAASSFPLATILKIVGGLLLLAGFAGPWVYGPIGKSADWGWQPVWGMLLSFWGINLVILISAISCYSYVELYYRLGRPPLSALLKWIGGFLGLVFVEPLVVWLIIDLSQRGPARQNSDGALGWGLWAALVGQVLLVAGLRLQIREVRKTLTVDR